MTKINTIAMAVAALAASLSVSAQTQSTEYNPSWYLSPSIFKAQADTQVGADKDSTGLGLRMGKAVSPYWDVQLGITGMRPADNVPRLRQTTLGLDGLYMFSRDKLRPFALLGVGLQRDEVENGIVKTAQTSPFLSVGVGVQASLTEQLGLQLDFRRNHAYLDNGDNYNNINTAGYDTASSNRVTLSLNFAFDKPTAVRYAAPAAPMPNPVMTEPAPTPYVAPAPAPAPMAAVTVPPRYERYTLKATELFGFDSSTLQMPQTRLDEIATALIANRDVSNVVITGYTDRIGSNKYNQALSQRRANAVKEYLTGKGLDANRLNAMGKGEANPVVMCTEKKMAALIVCLEPNRRVEIDQITVQRRVQ